MESAAVSSGTSDLERARNMPRMVPSNRGHADVNCRGRREVADSPRPESCCDSKSCTRCLFSLLKRPTCFSYSPAHSASMRADRSAATIMSNTIGGRAICNHSAHRLITSANFDAVVFERSATRFGPLRRACDDPAALPMTGQEHSLRRSAECAGGSNQSGTVRTSPPGKGKFATRP